MFNFLSSSQGTTLLLSILDESTLWVANVGDSRGVLRNVKGEVIPLSFDHKPSQVCIKLGIFFYKISCLSLGAWIKYIK